jgi:hypothetical protein
MSISWLLDNFVLAILHVRGYSLPPVATVHQFLCQYPALRDCRRQDAGLIDGGQGRRGCRGSAHPGQKIGTSHASSDAVRIMLIVPVDRVPVYSTPQHNHIWLNRRHPSTTKP